MVAVSSEVSARARMAAETMGRSAPLRAAYLFGSHADGRADEWSDIDVAVFLDGVESWDVARETQLILQTQKAVGYDVEPHVFSSLQLKSAEPGSFAAEVIRRGHRIL
jgi:predicted nucleotidyltransferase